MEPILCCELSVCIACELEPIVPHYSEGLQLAQKGGNCEGITFPCLREHHFSTQAALIDKGDQSEESQEEVGARGFLILAVNCEAPTSKKK